MSPAFRRSPWIVPFLAGALVAGAVTGPGWAVTVEKALSYNPVQKDVEYDRPAAKELADCTIASEKIGQYPAWIVRGPAGQVLRAFLDTNADNQVDQWRYYFNGAESYRDIDSDFNNKADAYRWVGYSGVRRGLDKNEDGQIDAWQEISAEEVTFEVFAALRDRDAARFARVLVSPEELESLGFSAERKRAVAGRLATASKRFQQALASQPPFDARAEWVHFGAIRPGVLPAGNDGATSDVVLYENAGAMIQSAGKPAQINVGSLVQGPNGWRLLDCPAELAGETANAAAATPLFYDSLNRAPEQTAAPENALTDDMRDLINQLGEVEKSIKAAKTPAETKAAYEKTAALLRQLAAQSKTQNDQAVWIRQLADTLGSAAQQGEYADGIVELKRLHKELVGQAPKSELTAYVQYRLMLAEYSLNIQKADPKDFESVQKDWTDQLAAFVEQFPTSEDSPEAMWQLAVAEEIAQNDEKALEWCEKIIALGQEKSGITYRKAEGARRRLTSVGKPLELNANTTSGKPFDVKQARGRMVLIHFWATWSDSCVEDTEALALLTRKYNDKFLPVGVSLDRTVADVDGFVKEHEVKWPQIFSEGGLDSPLAIDLGVTSVPTMILLDTEGKVIDRNVNVADLRDYLEKKLR